MGVEVSTLNSDTGHGINDDNSQLAVNNGETRSPPIASKAVSARTLSQTTVVQDQYRQKDGASSSTSPSKLIQKPYPVNSPSSTVTVQTLLGTVHGTAGVGKSALLRRLRGEDVTAANGSHQRSRRHLMALIPWGAGLDLNRISPSIGSSRRSDRLQPQRVQLHISERQEDDPIPSLPPSSPTRRTTSRRRKLASSTQLPHFIIFIVDRRSMESLEYARHFLEQLQENNGGKTGAIDGGEKGKIIHGSSHQISVCILLNHYDIESQRPVTPEQINEGASDDGEDADNEHVEDADNEHVEDADNEHVENAETSDNSDEKEKATSGDKEDEEIDNNDKKEKATINRKEDEESDNSDNKEKATADRKEDEEPGNSDKKEKATADKKEDDEAVSDDGETNNENKVKVPNEGSSIKEKNGANNQLLSSWVTLEQIHAMTEAFTNAFNSNPVGITYTFQAMDACVLNGYGMQALNSFFALPYLEFQRQELEKELACVQKTLLAVKEIDLGTDKRSSDAWGQTWMSFDEFEKGRLVKEVIAKTTSAAKGGTSILTEHVKKQRNDKSNVSKESLPIEETEISQSRRSQEDTERNHNNKDMENSIRQDGEKGRRTIMPTKLHEINEADDAGKDFERRSGKSRHRRKKNAVKEKEGSIGTETHPDTKRDSMKSSKRSVPKAQESMTLATNYTDRKQALEAFLASDDESDSEFVASNIRKVGQYRNSHVMDSDDDDDSITTSKDENNERTQEKSGFTYSQMGAHPKDQTSENDMKEKIDTDVLQSSASFSDKQKKTSKLTLQQDYEETIFPNSESGTSSDVNERTEEKPKKTDAETKSAEESKITNQNIESHCEKSNNDTKDKYSAEKESGGTSKVTNHKKDEVSDSNNGLEESNPTPKILADEVVGSRKDYCDTEKSEIELKIHDLDSCGGIQGDPDVKLDQNNSDVQNSDNSDNGLESNELSREPHNVETEVNTRSIDRAKKGGESESSDDEEFMVSRIKYFDEDDNPINLKRRTQSKHTSRETSRKVPPTEGIDSGRTDSGMSQAARSAIEAARHEAEIMLQREKKPSEKKSKKEKKDKKKKDPKTKKKKKTRHNENSKV